MNLTETISNLQMNFSGLNKWIEIGRNQKTNLLELIRWIQQEKEAIENYTQNLRERNVENYSDELATFLGRMDIPFDYSYYEDKNLIVPGFLEGAYVLKNCVTPKASIPFDYNKDWLTIFSQSINDLGKKLADQVKQSTSKPVNLIGRSMGGIIARKSLNYLTPKDIRLVATIATPHQGTYAPILISFLLGPIVLANKSCREMLPTSALIKELQHQELPDGITYINIYTDSHDQLCIPKSNLIWPDSKVENISLPTGGHAGTLSSPQVWKIINQKIKELDNQKYN